MDDSIDLEQQKILRPINGATLRVDELGFVR